MIVRVLGSAAGGGVPQWNCGCANCSAVRRGERAARTQSSFAVSPDGLRWMLVNCSPDVTRQIEETPALQPRAKRGTPIEGIAFTDANVDHLGGLADLRQAGEHAFTLFSSSLVRELAVRQIAFAKFAEPPHHWLVPDAHGAPAPGSFGLEVRAIDVPGTSPGYDGRRRLAGAVTAYEISSGSATVLFAPVYAALDEELRTAVARSDVAFLDGSFYRDDEMEGFGSGGKRASALGHLPISGPGGTLGAFAGLRNRRILAHVNNTNPILDPGSAEARAVRQAGFEVAYDGLELRM